ncbi:hypothetical protein [Actinophytocola xinjiangensis]|uniref:hypothetical protein n=1 Tax=Actinophytocola xinjiangensis TaxID=485602 RepID=UPI0012B8E812|nr:hypothetical protein [Actinophytocola xinjiangensis]
MSLDGVRDVDAIAVEYANTVASWLRESPLDRAMVTAFSGSRTWSSSWKGFSSMRTTGRVGSYGRA